MEVARAERLRTAGYATHAVGKWHVGFFERAYTPLRRGFDGVLRPQPRWSNRMIRYISGFQKRRMFSLQPPPGPPWRKTTGLPFGSPHSS